MDDLVDRYAPLMRQLADLYADDRDLREYIAALTIRRERRDETGGRLWFCEAARSANVELVNAFADDADGGSLGIVLHLVNACENWADWFRMDGKRPLRWPPPTLRRDYQRANLIVGVF